MGVNDAEADPFRLFAAPPGSAGFPVRSTEFGLNGEIGSGVVPGSEVYCICAVLVTVWNAAMSGTTVAWNVNVAVEPCGKLS